MAQIRVRRWLAFVVKYGMRASDFHWPKAGMFRHFTDRCAASAFPYCRFLANAAIGWLTIPIMTAWNGGSVQQRLSAAGRSRILLCVSGAADKRYSFPAFELTHCQSR